MRSTPQETAITTTPYRPGASNPMERSPMCMRKGWLVASIAAFALAACATTERDYEASAHGAALGEAATASDIALVDISIPPTGAGLPAGSGDARAGAKVFAAKCQVCHGEKGAGKPG